MPNYSVAMRQRKARAKNSAGLPGAKVGKPPRLVASTTEAEDRGEGGGFVSRRNSPDKLTKAQKRNLKKKQARQAAKEEAGTNFAERIESLAVSARPLDCCAVAACSEDAPSNGIVCTQVFLKSQVEAADTLEQAQSSAEVSSFVKDLKPSTPNLAGTVFEKDGESPISDEVVLEKDRESPISDDVDSDKCAVGKSSTAPQMPVSEELVLLRAESNFGAVVKEGASPKSTQNAQVSVLSKFCDLHHSGPESPAAESTAAPPIEGAEVSESEAQVADAGHSVVEAESQLAGVSTKGEMIGEASVPEIPSAVPADASVDGEAPRLIAISSERADEAFMTVRAEVAEASADVHNVTVDLRTASEQLATISDESTTQRNSEFRPGDAFERTATHRNCDATREDDYSPYKVEDITSLAKAASSSQKAAEGGADSGRKKPSRLFSLSVVVGAIIIVIGCLARRR